MKSIKRFVFLMVALAALLSSCSTDPDEPKRSFNEAGCNAVSQLTIGATSDKVTLAWVNPSMPYYGVKISMTPAEGELADPKTYGTETMNVTISGLKPETKYTFTFTSIDADGNDTLQSVSISTSTSAQSVEDPPVEPVCNTVKQLTIGATSDMVTLAWTNPSEPYYGVKISMDPAEGDLAEPKKYSTETTSATSATSATIGGLKPETKYTFTFTSIDADGNDTSQYVSISTTTSAQSDGNTSVEKPPVGDTTAPGNATGLKVTASASAISVKWTDATDSDIFGYIVVCTEKSTDAARSVLVPLEKGSIFVLPGVQKCEFTDIKDGKTYTVTVKTMDTSGNISNGSSNDVSTVSEDISPIPFGSRTENLDFIFGTESVAEIAITIKRSEWDTMLDYYDQNSRNEECVHADFEMTKDVHTWKIKDIGFRPRGNTSRVRPQYGDTYNQAHFKIDFEEWLSDDDPERKLAGCMKGMILKRFKDDPTYSREVFGYNFFRENGIWTSPRAGYAHLVINITEEDGKTTKIDYGVYAMIEEIKKQFLKERSEPDGGKFKNNKGNLWKCCWQSSNGASMTKNFDTYRSFGIEDISLTESLSLRYDYDLKTNKDDFSTARAEFINFINDLNKTRTVDETKKWFESKMDVDLFLKTYACNVLLGMDDDYWRNKNNYYFYFDKSGKAYFIPYDYDNILGINIFEYNDPTVRNPLNWGEGNDAPLIDRMLSVPEFMEKYRNYLLELSDEKSGFVTKSQYKIKNWQNLVEPYLSNSSSDYNECASAAYNSIEDITPAWCKNNVRYKFLSGDEYTNYFKAKAKSVQTYCNPTYTTLTLHFNEPNGAGNASLSTQDEGWIYTSPYTLKNALAGAPISQYIKYIDLDEYVFIDWFDAADGGKQVVEIPNIDASIYAHWRETQHYQITFDANGGKDSDKDTWSKTVSEIQNLYVLFRPIKENTFFIGWFDAPNGGNEITFPSSDMTVYAHYVPFMYTYWTSEEDENGEPIEYLKFTFNPDDFNVSGGIKTVVVACDLNGWESDGSRGGIMTRENDGTYTYTYDSKNYGKISSMWPGYKFVVDGDWLGYDSYKYKYQLPEKYAEHSPFYNFLIPEFEN